ncbi:hypothetical protein MKX03_004750, partial [Papaver bracteatum]
MDYTRKSYFLQQEQETYHFHHQERPKKHSNSLHHQLPHLNTSFSSSLLDEIYKSFDETTSYNSSSSCFQETTIMKKKMMTQSCVAAPITSSRTSKHHSSSVKGGSIRDHQQRDSVAVKEESGRTKQRNIVDKWVLEKKKKTKGNDEKLIVDLNNKINLRKKTAASSVPVDTTHRYLHSTSSSSDSSSGGGFSSSETESVYGSKSAKSTKSSAAGSFFVRPIRTRGSSTVHHSEKSDQILRNHPSKSKAEDNEGRSGGGNGKAKSRAMKIYNDLIKVKQPISPGGKISSFLNSLFTPKKSSIDLPATTTTKSTFTRTAPPVLAATPTCSSASSYSRSCLSKTPSLSNNGNLKQRSVRFYPVNIIHEERHHHQDSSKPSCREQSQPNHYNQKQQRTSNRISSEEEFKNKISEIKKNNQRFLVEEVIDIDKLLMANYQRKDEKSLKVHDEDEYDDDRASYASSDLFELDNLSTIGLEINAARFSEELPVYETTHFETNR